MANKPDYSGYHDCPCRDCFDVAIGGLLVTSATSSDDIDACEEEDRTVPALCLLCMDAECDHTGQSECRRSDAYGGDEDGDECPHCQNGTVEAVDGEARCKGECGSIWSA